MKREEASTLGPIPESSRAPLDRYAQILAERAVPLGFVGRGDVDRVRTRHVMDSLRAIGGLDQLRCRTVVDLGSGGGLPGIPVAICRPTLLVWLTERNQRKAAFLEWAAGELGLRNVRVHAGPAELLPEAVDACTARAFGPPERTWRAAERILRPGGALVYFAGRGWGDRISALRTAGLEWRICSPRVAEAGPVVIIQRGRRDQAWRPHERGRIAPAPPP